MKAGLREYGKSTPFMNPTAPNILIVDDEEGIREAFRESLEAAGYVCHAASSSEAALGRDEEAQRDRIRAAELGFGQPQPLHAD